MPPVRRWRWSLAVPLVALAALFGMHGLGDHSGAHAAAPLHAAHHDVAAPGHLGATVSSSGPHADSPAGSPAMQAAGDAGPAVVCLAVLLGGALALALLARAARRTPWLLPRLSRLPAAVAAGRDRDPPALLSLCVCRC